MPRTAKPHTGHNTESSGTRLSQYGQRTGLSRGTGSTVRCPRTMGATPETWTEGEDERPHRQGPQTAEIYHAWSGSRSCHEEFTRVSAQPKDTMEDHTILRGTRQIRRGTPVATGSTPRRSRMERVLIHTEGVRRSTGDCEHTPLAQSTSAAALQCGHCCAPLNSLPPHSGQVYRSSSETIHCSVPWVRQ
jgi:hypothetical protein